MDAVAAAASPHAVDEAGRRARHRRREQKRQRHLHSPASTSTTAATAMPAAASGADQQQAHTAPSPVTLATSDGPSSTARLRLPPQPPVPIACPPAERSPEPQALQHAAERLPVLSQPANAAAPVTPNALAVGASPVLRSARAIDADVSVIGRTTRPLGIVRASRRPPEKDEDEDEYEEVPEDESGAGGLKGKNTSDAPGEYQLEGDSGDRVKKHETRGGGAPTPKASEAKDSGRQMSELLHSLLNRLGNAAFAMRPLPPGARVCCRVTRNEKLMFRGTTAEYTLCIEDMGAVDCSARGVWGAHREVTAAGESSEREQQPKCAYLLAARRKFKCRGLQYLISTDPLCIHKRFDTYIGKLRSLNFMGTASGL